LLLTSWNQVTNTMAAFVLHSIYLYKYASITLNMDQLTHPKPSLNLDFTYSYYTYTDYWILYLEAACLLQIMKRCSATFCVKKSNSLLNWQMFGKICPWLECMKLNAPEEIINVKHNTINESTFVTNLKKNDINFALRHTSWQRRCGSCFS
jgi:hypothetical protein